ncbi:MAG: DNA-binding protein [Pseudomonadota bacterium]
MPRTKEEVLAEFQRKGIAVAAWATAHGFNTNLVWEVLAGRKKGVRGQSHKIAVMLGLKEGEVADPRDIAYGQPAHPERRHGGRRATDKNAAAA